VDELGKNIVVQGGTFLNDAVLRSFEKELGRNVVRPAIAGLMGAFGAALYAKENCSGEASSIIAPDALEEFNYRSKQLNCGGCTAHCNLTMITFNDGHKLISGNRCENGAGIKRTTEDLNLFEYKYKRLLSSADAKPASVKAKVGLPLALGMYEQLPFWSKLFTELGFEVIISEESTRKTYYKGQNTIPSDTVCYPAKLAHGHIVSLLEKGADFIFWPCESYNVDDGESDNHYNCPVVAYYPELIKANMPELNDDNFISPYIDINLPRHSAEAISQCLSRYGITKKQAASALEKAHEALDTYMKDIENEGTRITKRARELNMPIIVIAGRPYHLDPEINHGIHKLISSLGLAVITEDSVYKFGHTPKLDVLNQWTYHSRLYKAAQYVTKQPDMQLVQLVSFGCGIDAITTDEVRSILESGGKLYTQLKIDEINNLGAAKIRLRSLVAAMK
jgi:predicted nucleotide-binding protein (sugar kinase/HSP70/actin superfamily)